MAETVKKERFWNADRVGATVGVAALGIFLYVTLTRAAGVDAGGEELIAQESSYIPKDKVPVLSEDKGWQFVERDANNLDTQEQNLDDLRKAIEDGQAQIDRDIDKLRDSVNSYEQFVSSVTGVDSEGHAVNSDEIPQDTNEEDTPSQGLVSEEDLIAINDISETAPGSELTERQEKMIGNIGMTPEQFEKFVVDGDTTYITDGKGNNIAKIIPTESVKGVDYIVSTIGENKPFQTVNMIKDATEIDLEGKIVRYENHTVDDNNPATNCITAEQWKNNEYILIQYGDSCAAPKPEPVVDVPVEPKPEPQPKVVKPPVEPECDLCEGNDKPVQSIQTRYATASAFPFGVSASEVSTDAIRSYDEDILPRKLQELLIENRSAVLADLESDSSNGQMPFIITEGQIGSDDLAYAAQKGHYQTYPHADGTKYRFNVQIVGENGLKRPYCITLNDSQLKIVERGGAVLGRLDDRGFLTLRTPNGSMTITDEFKFGEVVGLPEGGTGIARPTSWWNAEIKRDAHFTNFKTR